MEETVASRTKRGVSMLSFIFFALIILSAVSPAFPAESQKFDRIRMGYSSISSSRIAL
jgi:hypothetical protein